MAGDEDAALMAEIARLSGQIDQHKTSQYAPASASASSSSSYYQPSYAPRGRGRGGSAFRGHYVSSRGRAGAPMNASRNRTLVINPGSTGATPAGVSAAAPSAAGPSALASTSSSNTPAPNGSTVAVGPSQSGGWVKRKTTHNMSLVSSSTFEKTEPARLAALQASQEQKAAARAVKASLMSAKKATKSKAKSDAAVRRGDNMGEVIIDGVVFVFDETGTKLVKKPAPAQGTTDVDANGDGKTPDSAAAETSSSPSKAPLRTSINGQSFIRTKKGNLISAELHEKRKAQREHNVKLKRMAKLGQQIGAHEKGRSAGKRSHNKTLEKPSGPKGLLCSFFTKTGQCKRGLSCPYKHETDKIAICPGALRPAGCSQPAGLCPLSHQLDPHRTPHCVHFLRSGGRSCRNGDACLYVHPSLSVLPHLTGASAADDDASAQALAAPICMDFARLGWCERGKLCTQRHTFDCPDFIEKGSCERKGCRLQHVIRPGAAAAAAATSSSSSAAAIPDSDLFARDDVQASGQDEDEDRAAGDLISDVDPSGTRKHGKRKLLEGMHATDRDDSIAGEEAEPAFSFLPLSKKRKGGRAGGKGFDQERDFIGFDEPEEEDDDDDDDAEESGSEDGEESVEEDDSDVEGSSVASDDEEDDGEDEDGDEGSSGEEASGSGSDASIGS